MALRCVGGQNIYAYNAWKQRADRLREPIDALFVTLRKTLPRAELAPLDAAWDAVRLKLVLVRELVLPLRALVLQASGVDDQCSGDALSGGRAGGVGGERLACIERAIGAAMALCTRYGLN